MTEKKTSKKQAKKEPVFNNDIMNADGYVKAATYGITSNPANPQAANSGPSNNEIVQVIDRVFSTDDVDQKTFLNSHQIEGLIELRALLAYDANTYGFVDRVAYSIDRNTIILNKSLNGFGLLQLVAMFRDVYNTITEKARASFADLHLIK